MLKKEEQIELVLTIRKQFHLEAGSLHLETSSPGPSRRKYEVKSIDVLFHWVVLLEFPEVEGDMCSFSGW